MSGAIPQTGTDAAKPHTQRFRRAFQPNIATPDQRRRETEVLRLAWDALGSRERILAFLNAPAEPLGGATPLQLASNSDAGLEQVAILLTEQRAMQAPAPTVDAAR